MSSERESGLALMNINYHRDINIEEVIKTFAQPRQPRRPLFAYRKRQSLVRTKCLFLDQPFSLEPIWNPPS